MTNRPICGVLALLCICSLVVICRSWGGANASSSGLSGKYDFPDERWGDVSEHAKELIKGLLVTDPSKRLTAKQAMAGRWMRDRGDLLRQHSLMMSQRRIKTFNARMKLRSAMINIRFLSNTSVWKKNASGLGSSVTAPPTQATIDENILEDEA